MCIFIQSFILWPGPMVSKVAAPSDPSSESDNGCIFIKVGTFGSILVFFPSEIFYKIRLIVYPAHEWMWLGWVYSICHPVQILTRLLQGDLMEVTMYSAHISSNWGNYFKAVFLVYWTYKVSCIGAGQTNLDGTMCSKCTPI